MFERFAEIKFVLFTSGFEGVPPFVAGEPTTEPDNVKRKFSTSVEVLNPVPDALKLYVPPDNPELVQVQNASCLLVIGRSSEKETLEMLAASVCDTFRIPPVVSIEDGLI